MGWRENFLWALETDFKIWIKFAQGSRKKTIIEKEQIISEHHMVATPWYFDHTNRESLVYLCYINKLLWLQKRFRAFRRGSFISYLNMYNVWAYLYYLWVLYIFQNICVLGCWNVTLSYMTSK